MRNRTRAGVLAAGLLVLGSGAGAQELTLPPVQPVDTVTVDEAVSRALEANPQVVQAETGLGTAEFGTKTAWAAMMPSLSLSSGASASSSDRYDPSTNLRVTGQSSSYSAGLSASMDLFAGGRNLAQVRSARASVRAAEAGLVTRRFSVALSAKQGFFAVLRAEDLIALNQELIRQAQEQLSAAQRRLQAGLATRSDVLRAQLQLRNAQQALLQAETQRRTSMYALGQMVGVVGPVDARRPESLAPAPLALSQDAMREIVLQSAPTVASAEANVRVAQASLSQARAQYFPTLGLSGGYNWSNSEFTMLNGRTSWSTSLRLSYPLFNGLQREANVDRANAQLVVAEAQAADANRAALAEYERLLAALDLAEQQLSILEESVAVAQEDYRVQRERYDHGTATILELVSSQIALTQAEHDLINARYDYQIAKAELASLVGREL